VLTVTCAVHGLLSQVAFNPYDQSVLTVCGHNLFKSFRLVDIHFKPLTPYLGKGKQPGYADKIEKQPFYTTEARMEAYTSKEW
jgi:hypothetical protein